MLGISILGKYAQVLVNENDQQKQVFYQYQTHTSGTGQLQENSTVVGSRLSSGKPTQRAVSTIGSNDLVVDEDHLWDRVASGISGNRGGEAR